MYINGSHLRAVTDANDVDDDAGRRSTTTSATYRQLSLVVHFFETRCTVVVASSRKVACFS